MSVRFLAGDCRDVLPTLGAESFDCVVTSPPYFGLRDYGVEGQIGLEPTLDGYVEALCGVFDELWRVLKPSGTAWLNLGDSYAANGTSGLDVQSSKSTVGKANPRSHQKKTVPLGLKPKDLCGVPWRVAFALQARGWWLRSAIVWSKPNCMPESVTDRPTSAYEMVFLLTKAERYWYDAEAIAEDASDVSIARVTQANFANQTGGEKDYRNGVNPSRSMRKTLENFAKDPSRRNARNVWTIATQPYRGSHFATMPPDLAERCIKAGCPKGGRVLDPFGGAGTTGLVADRLGRHATLIELNPSYIGMGSDRIRDDAPLFAQVEATA